MPLENKTPKNKVQEDSLSKPVTSPIAFLVIGLMSALVITTTISGFGNLKQILGYLDTQQNYASVATVSKSRSVANSSILNTKPQETNRIIVKFKENNLPPGISVATEKANLEKAQGLKRVSAIKGIGALIYEVPEKDTASEVVDKILASKRNVVEYAEVDMKFASNATYTPNDPYYPNDWHWFISNISADTAWDSVKGSGVTIAILDSGVNCSHPDLSANCVSGWNTYNNSSDTSDQHSHGTLVTGAAASVGDNSEGGVGVAYESNIMPVRVSDADGYTTCSALANGIIYAADNGARVASNSYKIVGCTSVNQAADYMADKGGLYVRAIGNDNYEVFENNPANIIHVSATNENNTRTSWSNYGEPVDIAAPGINIYCTTLSGSYGYCWGTSLSVPIVSGTLALMFSANPALTADEAKSILFGSADDLGVAGWDKYYGHGKVNAARAVASAIDVGSGDSADTQAPDAPTNLSYSNVTDSSVSLSWSPANDNVLTTGYYVYRDGSKIATVSDTNYIDSNLSPNTSYSYTVSAFDSAGNESGKSIALTVTTNETMLEILSYSVVNKTTNSATIDVSLSDISAVDIKYGTDSNNLNLLVESTTDNNKHSLDLTNLTSRTVYYYQITATASDGETVMSNISSFKTLKAKGGNGGGKDDDESGGGNNKGKGKPIK